MSIPKRHKNREYHNQQRKRIYIEEHSHSLMFHPIKGSDGGVYTCLFNNNPDAEAVVRLVVLGKCILGKIL